MEILWKGTVFTQFRACHPKICGNWAFPQNFRIGKLGEITAFYAVSYQVVRTCQFFLKKTCSSQNEENGPKIGFSEFIEKFGRYFFLNLVYNESLNTIFGKNLVPEIWVKVLLANISGTKRNNLIFCKFIEKYWVGVVKNGHGNLK